ncbi:hypothetical protein SteCoe_31549 [Stentor coeruleus]|uniref:PH domain-containing protein n=1 Tax=Stentor coeruleus TaxID=5963 RepID=A0A1R2B190_9CILI|nr:hypothetical protein SteCoe_31549 [Stentor coeruleus]
MAKESFVIKNLLGASPAFTCESRIFDSISERFKPGSVTSPFVNTQYVASPLLGETMQGEMRRFKKGSKELNIPRWCVLTSSTFKYYKNQFSAMCEDKPLYTIPTALITSVKAISKHNEYVLEIITGEDEITTTPMTTKIYTKSTVSLATEKHLLNKPRHLNPKLGKCTKPTIRAMCMANPNKKLVKSSSTVRNNRNSWTSRENMMYMTEERLIFFVTNKDEWEKWQRSFRVVAKVEVTKGNN